MHVIPGSHRLGALSNPEVELLAAFLGRSRVFQLDYSADELPGGLEWLDLAE
jgi:hypothetical protein